MNKEAELLAVILKLREALEKLTHNNFDTYDEVAELAFAALAQPTDDSALQAAIAAEREACAVVCEYESVDEDTTQEKEDFAYNMAIERCAAAIRARGDSK